MRVKYCLAAFIGTMALSGCSYAPQATILPEREQSPSSLDGFLAKNDSQRAVSVRRLALRGSRVVEGVKPNERDLVAALPSFAATTGEARGYVPLPAAGNVPPSFPLMKEGDRHMYDFPVTKDFAAANAAYVQSDGATALAAIERVLSTGRETTTDATQLRMLWQASCLKIMIHVLMGRGDLAETETARAERFEVKAVNTNILSRALRAEARLFAGDFDQAALDAAQVNKQIGDWRFPTTYPAPPTPSEQMVLQLTTGAQIAADLVLGQVLVRRGLYKEARPWLDRVYRTLNDIAYLKYQSMYGRFMPETHETFVGRGYALAALASVETILDPLSTVASANFKRAAENFNYVGFRAGRSMVSCLRAFALSTAGRHAEAAQEAVIGVAAAESDGLLDFVWRLELVRGKSLFAIGRIDEAEKALRHAQSVVDQMAGAITSDKAKVQFVSGKEEIVTLLARIDVGRNNRVALFEDLERGRARAFVSMMAGRAVAAGGQDRLVRELRRLDGLILAARQRKYAVTRTATASDSETALINQRQQVIGQLRAAAPELADIFQVSAPSIAKARGALRAGQAIVYFFELASDEPLHQLVITLQSDRVVRLNVTPKALQSVLDSFSDAIKTGNVAVQKSTLAGLDRELRISDLNEYKQIYVVPSGPVHFIPWGGLSLSAPVAVLPTASWVARSDKSNRSSVDAVLVGDPEFGGLAPQLPAARAEADTVGRIYGSRPLIGALATESALRGAVGNGARVLHLATHALYDPRFPLKSALILTDGKSAAPLTAERLFERPLSARLVVLSACESGLGQVAAGDDMLGLARGFYFGGARAIVSSLWEVEDEPTKLFMEAFHEEARKSDFGNAWVVARNKLKAGGYPPSNYAPFIVSGGFS